MNERQNDPAPETQGELSEEALEQVNGGASQQRRVGSLPFGVEREMKESGEKAGTAVSIGVGELQESPLNKLVGGS